MAFRLCLLAAAILAVPACDPEPAQWDTGADVCGQILEGDEENPGEGTQGWVQVRGFSGAGTCPGAPPYRTPDSADTSDTAVFAAPEVDENGYFSVDLLGGGGIVSLWFGAGTEVPDDYWNYVSTRQKASSLGPCLA